MSEDRGVYHPLQENPEWAIEVTDAEGRAVLWHKNGRPNLLSRQLADTWVTHFKPHLFSVLPDGTFVARGTDARGKDIARVRMVKQDGGLRN